MISDEIKQYVYKHFPKKYCRKILFNMELQPRYMQDYRLQDFTPHRFIGHAFTWDRTPEGANYWRTLYDKIGNGEQI